jgi:anti-sigma factor RsiW
MSTRDPSHERAIDTALTEALQRLPTRPASARLVQRVQRVVTQAPRRAPARWRRALVPALAAALVLLVAVPVIVAQRGAASRAAAATMVSEAIGDHVRIVQAQRPLEVESTDSHQVRPWFQGRLDWAPVLPFAGDRDVPLRGGALAWFVDRRAAAFIYGLRLHTVTLLVFPPDGLPWPTTGWQRVGDREAYLTTARGFTVVMWRAHGFGYALVSDADAREVAELAARFGGA